MRHDRTDAAGLEQKHIARPNAVQRNELFHTVGCADCPNQASTLAGVDADSAFHEIHGGKDETSMMLAIAPHLVRRDLLAQLKSSPDEEAIRKAILQNGVTWPWTTDDRRLADTGVIGDAKSASAEFGQQMLNRVVETAGAVLKQLLGNQRFSRRCGVLSVT